MSASLRLPSDSCRMARDDWGRLRLVDAQGRRHARLRLKRMFPITDPEHWILVLDAQGRELAHVNALTDLPQSMRRLVLEELAQSEFLPRIQKIREIVRSGEALDWIAETDRGEARFRLENCDRIKELGEAGLLIIDEHGIRYVVREVAALDAASRRKLEWCLF